jgi:hypothetical protein
MTTLVVAFMTALAVAQCTVVDILAPRLVIPLVARPIVALYTGAMASTLAAPVMGRIGAMLTMLAMIAIAFLLPAGRGLSGVLLVPLALTLLKHITIQEKRHD